MATGVNFMLERRRILDRCKNPSKFLERSAAIRYKGRKHSRSTHAQLKAMDKSLEDSLRYFADILLQDEEILLVKTRNLTKFISRLRKKSLETTMVMRNNWAAALQLKIHTLKDLSIYQYLADGRCDEMNACQTTSELYDQCSANVEKQTRETIRRAECQLRHHGKERIAYMDGELEGTYKRSPIESGQASKDLDSMKTASARNTMSFVKTSTLLHSHRERHGIPYAGLQKVELQSSRRAASILQKKAELAEMGTLLEKTSKALLRPVPVLSAVPLRVLPDWFKGTPFRTNGCSRMECGTEGSWSAHGGSPLTYECMNMEKMVPRDEQIRQEMIERKRKKLLRM